MKIKLSHRIFISILKFLSNTWRLKVLGQLPEKPAIIVFWHGFMLPVWKLFSDFEPFGVVSKSHDGAILSSFLEKIGFRLIRGSSATGGKEVIEEMTGIAGQNYLLITPDGARGPIYKLKPGAFVVSQRTGTPIHICCVQISSKIIFKKSWDKFAFPLPFAKIRFSFSEPLYLPKEADRETVTEIILSTEKKMNNMYCLK